MKKIVNERRIKHWQGYGSVDAKVLRNTPENMIIQVKGMHEYGLDCGAWDTDRVYEWLVKRFDPSRKATDIKSVDIDDDYERQGNVDIEVCTYDIHFVDVDRFELAQEGKNDNPRFKMAESAITLKEIEKWYGKPTADALVEYCKKTKKSVDDVAGSDREWDRFEQDAKARKRSLGTLSKKFDDWAAAADMDGKRANKSAKRARKGRFGDVYSAPTDFSTMEESGGSRMTQWDIASWISDEVRDCEWADDVDFENDDYEDPWFRITTTDGDTFQVVVKKV